MPITDWPEDTRPRERLLSHGVKSLSDTELLALLLGTGVAGKSAVDLARDLIGCFGSLSALLGEPFAAFKAVPGIGPAKYALLQCAAELTRRSIQHELAASDALSSPQTVRDFLRLSLRDKGHEAFSVIYLDVRNQLLGYEEIFRGTLTQTSVYPREIVKASLKHNAAAVILAHNHPSGDPSPSSADHILTRNLKRALAVVDIDVHDHFIVAGNKTYSFSEHGHL
jgi:DNA repair protein RadC